MATSAITAGHLGKVKHITLGVQELLNLEDRKSWVLSSFKDDPPTGNDWLSFWGRASTQTLSVEGNLGEGTPFVLLYHFGWFLGKHWVGWLVGGIPIVAGWAMLLHTTLGYRGSFDHLWLVLFAQGIMGYLSHVWRVMRRTPKGFGSSRALPVAICLETILSLSLSFVGLGFGVLVNECVPLSTSKIVLPLLSCVSQLVLGSWVREVVMDRQAAVLRSYNLSSRMTRQRPQGQRSMGTVRTLIVDIMDRSRDLRVTGLDKSGLRVVAKALHDDGYIEEAEYIEFYLCGGRKWKILDGMATLRLSLNRQRSSTQTDDTLPM